MREIFPRSQSLGKQIFPFDQQLPGLLLFLLGPLLYALEVQFLQDPIFLGVTGSLLQGYHWENQWRHLIGWSNLTNCHLGRDYSGVSTQVPQPDWHLGGTRVLLSICGSQYNGGGQLGALCGPACNGFRCLSCHEYLWSQNRGMLTFCVVQTCPWTSSRQNSLDTVGSGATEGVTHLSAPPFPIVPLQGKWSNPDITTLKWVCIRFLILLFNQFRRFSLK